MNDAPQLWKIHLVAPEAAYEALEAVLSDFGSVSAQTGAAEPYSDPGNDRPAEDWRIETICETEPDVSAVTLALAATGATFLALSSYVLLTRRDFSFMGGFLFVGMVIALLAGLASVFFDMPALGLAVSAMVALLSAGLILFETSRIVNGGETNYVMATVGLFVSVFNLFTSLLSLFGLGGSND